MILTAHQPSYLPWLGLFHKIALADEFVFFDQVQYVPKDWISRNQIKTAAGPLMLTVPVHSKDYLSKTIAQIEIHHGTPWQRKHWKSIQINYKNAPFFAKYADFFEDCYSRDWKLLSDLNFHMLRYFLNVLGISTQVRKMGDYSFEGAKSGLVLDMCRQLGADVYIFGALGKDYADIEEFKRAGVIPVFQDYRHPVYSQLHGKFEPYMSILDLLFNEGPRSLEILLSGNEDRQTILQRHL